MQGLTPAAITASGKHTRLARLDVNNARLDIKNKVTRAKSRSRTLGHSVCMKSISRTTTMQSLTLTAITVSEKST